MSVQHTKYSTGDSLATMDVPMTLHALQRYRERLPPDAVSPAIAWRRGEDIQHPAVIQTLDTDGPPKRVRVYNHNQRYFAIFIVKDENDGEYDGDAVVSVYNSQTHEHGPTRSYLNSHGPHYREEEVSDE